MFGVMSSLHPVHIEITGFEIDLLPPQGHQFGRPQSMAKHHQNNRRISYPMASGFTRRLHHRIHLVRSKILAYGGIMLLFPGGNWTRLGVRLCRKRTLAGEG
jgi:hypothetical protein